jgi:hypothetical protein
LPGRTRALSGRSCESRHVNSSNFPLYGAYIAARGNP